MRRLCVLGREVEAHAPFGGPRLIAVSFTKVALTADPLCILRSEVGEMRHIVKVGDYVAVA